MFIQYTPTRNIVAPPSTGTLEIEIEPVEVSRKVEGEESVSSSGAAVETVIHRIDRFWPIRTNPVPRADYDLWQEFADSVAAGETFTIDAYGTQAVPDNPITARMVFNSFNESSLGSAYVVFSFRVRV